MDTFGVQQMSEHAELDDLEEVSGGSRTIKGAAGAKFAYTKTVVVLLLTVIVYVVTWTLFYQQTQDASNRVQAQQVAIKSDIESIKAVQLCRETLLNIHTGMSLLHPVHQAWVSVDEHFSSYPHSYMSSLLKSLPHTRELSSWCLRHQNINVTETPAMAESFKWHLFFFESAPNAPGQEGNSTPINRTNYVRELFNETIYFNLGVWLYESYPKQTEQPFLQYNKTFQKTVDLYEENWDGIFLASLLLTVVHSLSFTCLTLAAWVDVRAASKRSLQVMKAFHSERLRSDRNASYQAQEHILKYYSRLLHDLKTPIAILCSKVEELGASAELSITREDSNLKDSMKFIRMICTIVTDRVKSYSVSAREPQKMEYQNSLQTALAKLTAIYQPLFAEQEKIEYIQDHSRVDNNPALIPIDAIRRNTENLLSNALKFTDSGSVSVRFMTLNNCLTCEVEDTGKGVPENLRKSIFEGSQLQKCSGGIGMGLPSVKALSKSVECRNRKDCLQGSVFSFTVEIRRCVQSDECHESSKGEHSTSAGGDISNQQSAMDYFSKSFKDEHSKPLKLQTIPYKILLCDDDKLQLQMLEARVKKFSPQAIISKAENGAQGLEQLQGHNSSVGNEPKIALILTDFNMPIMDGETMCLKAVKQGYIDMAKCVILTANPEALSTSFKGRVIDKSDLATLRTLLSSMQ